jgi:UDP-2,3-diacylglucosamine pyrophosphatase LpxH
MALFISDCHLGNRRSKASELCRFLYGYDKDEVIYLVGDIFDDITLPSWPLPHIDALRFIMMFRDVIYIPGNHDKEFRKVLGLDAGRVKVMNEAVFYSTEQKKYLVKHGDSYDGSLAFIIGQRWLRNNGSRWFNGWHANHANRLLEKGAVGEAKARGFDGVITGHSHYPSQRIVDGIEFLNCGDWLNHCTAIVDRNGPELFRFK